MAVELNSDVKGIAFILSVITLRNNSSLEQISLPVINISDCPVTIQADEVLFSHNPILNIMEAHNVQYHATIYLTQNNEGKRSDQEVECNN